MDSDGDIIANAETVNDIVDKEIMQVANLCNDDVDWLHHLGERLKLANDREKFKERLHVGLGIMKVTGEQLSEQLEERDMIIKRMVSALQKIQNNNKAVSDVVATLIDTANGVLQCENN